MSAAGPRPRWARLLAAALVLLSSLPNPAFLRSAAAETTRPDSLTLTARVQDIWPPAPITNLAGIAGGEGQVLLQWSSPEESAGLTPKGRPTASYQIRAATFSVADLGGDTTAWFNLAVPVPAPPPLMPGSIQSALTTLEVATTYYFGVKSIDDDGLVSDVDAKTKLGSNQAKVGVKGIAGVTDISATPGAGIGSIDLSWSEPRRIGHINPLRYEIRVSTTGQIANNAQFEAAQPLSAFSPSVPPAASEAGNRAFFTVTGLVPGKTHYFALRLTDSGFPPFVGTWVRNVPAGLNPNNSSLPTFLLVEPDAVTNLSALSTEVPLQVKLTWTAPQTPGGLPIDHYVLKAATRSIADLAGDTTAWFNLPSALTYTVAASTPGTLESLTLNGLIESGTYYFAIKAVDSYGQTSLIDARADGVSTQARARPLPAGSIHDLTALTGTAAGSIDLTWSKPVTQGLTPPLRYVVHGSTTGQINNNDDVIGTAEFGELIGTTETSFALTLTGLDAFTTYYFAVCIHDDSGIQTTWARDEANGINANNYALPLFTPMAPDAVTNLSALAGSAEGEISLSWSAPRNQNFIPVTSYEVRFATVPAAADGVEDWFAAAVSSSILVSPAGIPGTKETLTLSGLEPAGQYFFAVKSADRIGEVSAVDSKASSGQQANARSKGIAPITDLRAVSGAQPGSVSLNWTEPYRSAATNPVRYSVRVSTEANIASDAEFAAARPLSAFSLTPAPVLGAGGGAAALLVTGLDPLATYYFALRAEDSGTLFGRWLREEGGRNTDNWSLPLFTPMAPDAVTNLSALSGPAEGEITLSWNAPRNQNFVPIDSYEVRFASYPASAGALDAWWAAASSSAALLSPAGVPGTRETLTLAGLDAGALYYFAVKSADRIGETSAADSKAGTASQAKARTRGLQPVTDLRAVSGSLPGSVSLSWTEPYRSATTEPSRYAMRVSTKANIASDEAFEAALPLSAFSATALPALGSGGAAKTLLLTGLEPFATYYFALRAEDSGGLFGRWLRDGSGRNESNWATAKFVPMDPEAVTNLSALTGSGEGELTLSWTAPRNQNFIPMASYEIRFATYPASSVGGAEAWWALSASSSIALSPAALPGVRETLTLGGFEPGRLYYFALKGYDRLLEVSPADTKAGTASQANARPRGILGIRDLSAQAGLQAGSISLSWTQPYRSGTTEPTRYVLKVSTLGNIADDAQFAAAQTLDAFSETSAPALGSGGTLATHLITGLEPFATYYFALRAEDSGGLIGRWLRDGSGRNTSNFSNPLFVPMAPDAVTDLAAAPGSAEGEIALSWSAPRNQNFVPMSSYEVRFATYPASAVGGADNWFELSASSKALVSPARKPGSLETLRIGGLRPAATVYFAVKGLDRIGEASPLDQAVRTGSQAFAKPPNFAPGTPSGLKALEAINSALVSWNGLSPAAKGLDFVEYRLYRSTAAGSGFERVISTSVVALTDKPLSPWTTYYYKVSAADEEDLESTLSTAASVVPFTLPPMEPFGIRQTVSSGTFTMNWVPTMRHGDGTLFESTSTPSMDELLGYQILRSSSQTGPFQQVAVNGLGGTSYTETVYDYVFYYQVHSFNSLGFSTGSLILSSLGEQSYLLDDGVTNLHLDAQAIRLLGKETTGLEEDIFIARRRSPNDTGGNILQAVEFMPMVGGGTPLPNFAFQKPVPVTLHFVTDEGAPAAQTASYDAARARGQRGTLSAGALAKGRMAAASTAARPAVAAEDVDHLGMFWHNGVEYKKLYGKVNPEAQTVSVQTPNIGKFQIRSVFRESGVTFDLSNITSRIFTPNNDGKNDVVIFLFDNPNRALVEGTIYDLRGARVGSMNPGPQPDSLMWDGRMDGRTVTSGVYIYQIKAEGKTFNGTVVVAR